MRNNIDILTTHILCVHLPCSRDCKEYNFDYEAMPANVWIYTQSRCHYFLLLLLTATTTTHHQLQRASLL